MKARSLLFGAVFFLWTAFITVSFSFLLVLPRRLLVWHLFFWAKGTMFLLCWIAGISYQVVGAENIPKEPALFLVNHLSMWETIIFHILAYRHDPCYVMKRQLFFVPFYGQHAWKFGMIGIRRGKEHGSASIKKMLRTVPGRFAAGQSVILFPEGTRVPIGESGQYGVGAYALYRCADQAEVPVVRVAMNSGCFWGRGFFDKRPGVITIRFLPVLPKGLDKKVFESSMGELRAEAQRLAR